MKGRGFEVHAVSSPGKLLDDFGEYEGVSVHPVPMSKSITPLRDLVAVARLWHLLRRIDPHIVHSHTPKGGLLGMIAGWLARTPVRVYHVHGLRLMTMSGCGRIVCRWAEKMACRLAHQVLCVSPSVREIMVSAAICPAHKIEVLEQGSINGVDAAERFNPAWVTDQARAEYRIPQDAVVIGFVGRIVPDKGMTELAEAWAVLSERFPALHLLLVGPFEAENPLAQPVEKLLLDDPRIHLTGWKPNTPPLYAAMDVLVLPSYREGFPLSPLEAAAMAVPVVATRIPGCVDAVQENATGMLVPPRDGPALAEALRTYITDAQLREEHGRAGREWVLHDFRQRPIWEALYDQYARLLAEKGVWPTLPHPVPPVGISAA